LEGAWAVIYAKGYDGIFKLAEARCECGFLFVPFPYSEIVKGGDDVELSINFGLTKPLKGLIYERYWVLVFNRNSIKSSIVNVESDTSSWLLGEKDRGGCW
jgi:hypothetical protein